LETNATLLREKFTLRDLENDGDAPIIAVSNRLALPLKTKGGDFSDTIIVRAQNMHLCLRMASQILQSFQTSGPLFTRNKPFDFEESWDRSCSSYEKMANLLRWCAIYHNGKIVYSFGTHHGFLDVIEKCDAKNPGNYDKAIGIAEKIFISMGRKVSISYDSNIAMVLNTKPSIGRCGLIYRGPEKTSTFNFVAEIIEEGSVSPVLCMGICSAFLEGLQLAYKIGVANDRLNLLLIEKYSSDIKQRDMALRRLAELNTEIRSFENRFLLRFRPEKPEFSQTVTDAERFHRKSYDKNNL